MAYTDSGLGWYANSDWMEDTAHTLIAEFSSGSGSGDYGTSPNGTLWVTDTSNLPNQMMYIGRLSDSGTGFKDYYVKNLSGAPLLVALEPAGGYGQLICACEWANISSIRSAHIISYNQGGAISDFLLNNAVEFSTPYPGVTALGTYGDPGYVYPTTQYAYYTGTREQNIDGIAYQYSISDFSRTIPLYKTSSGYCVASLVKWRESLGGDIYISPVLISTINTNTFWDVDGNTPIQTLSEHTFGGLNFFMRYAKLYHAEDYPGTTSTFPVLDYSDSAPLTDNLMFTLIAAASELGIGTPPQEDPYADAGESGPGGDGDGDFDFSSTDIPIPSLPSIGAMDAGFLQLFKMTASDLKSLAHYMWSGSFDPDNFRKLFADPMDAILGCSIIPTDGTHPAATLSEIKIGNVGTGILAYKCTEQYFELDCGTVQMPAKWGAYLDYAPYSKLSLYLPYIGMVPISPDDCMGGSITVKYHIDVLSGSCCVYVYCYSNRGADGHLLYVFNGSCACVVPVTAGQYTNAVFGILGAIGGIANSALSIVGATQTNQNGKKKGLSGVGGITGGIEEAFASIQGMIKPEIQRSGNIGASAGLMGPQYPFLVLNIPHMAIPGQQNVYQGYPSFVTKRVGDLSGYTEMQVSHLNGMTCTQSEANEIIELLSKGVIL